MDANVTSSYAISFSPEEMIYLLDCFQIPQIPGIDRGAYNDLSTEQKDLVREAAYRALLARGVLSVVEEKIQLDPFVLRLFLSNLAPQHSMMVGQRSDLPGVQTFYFHTLEDAHVLRFLNAQNNHEIILLSGKDAMSEVVFDLLDLKSDAKPDWPAVNITPELFSQVRQSALKNHPADAARLLSQTDLAPKAAAALVSCLVSTHTYRSVLAFHQTDETQKPSIKLSLIQGNNSLWRLEGVENNSSGPMWRLQPTSVTEITEQVQAFLAEY